VPAATPGFVNSQNVTQSFVNSATLLVEPEAFSPNADGIQDVAQIVAGDLLPGTQARLSVFDASGAIIRRLTPQATTGPTFETVWDGRTDTGEKAGAGLYVVLAEFYHPKKVYTARKARVGVQP
jgi:flagellar hook assembly protein FlgD